MEIKESFKEKVITYIVVVGLVILFSWLTERGSYGEINKEIQNEQH